MYEDGPYFYLIALEGPEKEWDGWPFDVYGNKMDTNPYDFCYPIIKDSNVGRIVKSIQYSIKNHKYPTISELYSIDPDKEYSVKFISLLIGTDPNDTSDWDTYLIFDSNTGSLISK